jgi:hypothetical protein
MSALSVLYSPVGKRPQSTGNPTGIIRQPDSMTVEILNNEQRSNFTNAAYDIMDTIALAHSIVGLMVDVRFEPKKPQGALNLATITDRFYDGNEELWVSRPGHMPPDLIRFKGRFGYRKFIMFPVNHGNFECVHWAWLDTNAGEVPGIDVGVVIVSLTEKQYRLFSNKSDATAYYQS